MYKSEFIERAINSHNTEFDYSLVPNKIVSTDHPEIICKICNKHFFPRVDMFIRGQSCPNCAINKKRKTTEQFIQKSKEIFGDKFNYEKTKYIGARQNITLICNDCGYEFEMIACNHLAGQSCPKCQNKLKITKEIFIERAKEIHQDKYDYSKAIINGSKNYCTIICKKCGNEFEQQISAHLQGNGCPKCSNIRKKLKEQEKNKELFLKQAKEIYQDKYDYSKINYINAVTPVLIRCKKCNYEFYQTPNNHIFHPSECQNCNNNFHHLTKEIFIERANLIHQNKYDYSNVNYINNYTKVSIYCPKHGYFEQIPANHLQGKGCPKCSIEKQVSYSEKEVVNFLKSILN